MDYKIRHFVDTFVFHRCFGVFYRICKAEDCLRGVIIHRKSVVMRLVLTFVFIIFIGIAGHARPSDVTIYKDKVEPLKLSMKLLPQEFTFPYPQQNEFAMVYRSRKNMVKRELFFKIKSKGDKWV